MDEEPAYQIDFHDADHALKVSNEPLRRAVEAVLRRHVVRSARIGVALVDDGTMAELHEQFLGLKGPTDVLSFDLIDSDSEPGRTGLRKNSAPSAGKVANLEGEIVVSVDTASREATRRGHSLEAELALYTVHGVLHLLGYDDGDESESRIMHAMEDDILTSVGLGSVFRDSQP